jgi:hypothetical protein
MTLEEKILANYKLIDGKVYGPRGLLRGTNLSRGYIGTYIHHDGKLKRVLLHRMVYLLAHGYLPETVDHINRNPSDNRVENLRAATKREQQSNRSSKGFSIRTKNYKKPRYEVSCDHKYIGVFDTEEEARVAYAAAKHKAFGDFILAYEAKK